MNRKIINLLFCIFTFFLFSLNSYAHDYNITKYDVQAKQEKQLQQLQQQQNKND